MKKIPVSHQIIQYKTLHEEIKNKKKVHQKKNFLLAEGGFTISKTDLNNII
jgi:hypothetical protein